MKMSCNWSIVFLCLAVSAVCIVRASPHQEDAAATTAAPAAAAAAGAADKDDKAADAGAKKDAAGAATEASAAALGASADDVTTAKAGSDAAASATPAAAGASAAPGAAEATDDDDTTCEEKPPDAIEVNTDKKMYVLYKTPKHSFFEAILFCKDRGGGLSAPRNKKEWDAVSRKLVNNFDGTREYWIGVIRDQIGGKPYFHDTKETLPTGMESMVYPGWEDTDAKLKFPEQDINVINTLGLWRTRNINLAQYKTYGTVCEFSNMKKVGKTTKKDSIVQYGDQVYVNFYSRFYTYKDSKKFCTDRGGRMARLNTEEVHRAVVIPVNQKHFQIRPQSQVYQFWMPIKFFGNQWRWDDGSSLPVKIPEDGVGVSYPPWRMHDDSSLFASANGYAWQFLHPSAKKQPFLCDFAKCPLKPKRKRG